MKCNASERATPMASAPLKYRPDGTVDWGNMWDTFCGLARDGGPPHRGTLLEAPPTTSLDSRDFQAVAAEIVRGIGAVSGLPAFVSAPGWIGVRCPSGAMARWLSESIVRENVEARFADNVLLLPAGEDYTVAHEIKNVITAVAKTTHYWKEHTQRERSFAQRAHPETVVLDIGGDVGALIIYAGQHLRGQQIDVTAEAITGPPIHTDILERRRNGRAVCAAVFPSLREGPYRIWAPDPSLVDKVMVRGGEVAEVDWR